MALVVPYMESIQYDGTNGSYIVNTWLNGAVTLVSDNGATLVWENVEEYTRSVSVNGWLVKQTGNEGDPSPYTNAQYTAQYVELP